MTQRIAAQMPMTCLAQPKMGRKGRVRTSPSMTHASVKALHKAVQVARPHPCLKRVP